MSLCWPIEAELPLVDILDTGVYIAPLLLNPDKYNGKIFASATAFYSTKEIIDTFTRVTGRKLIYVDVKSPEEMNKAMPPEMAKVLADLRGVLIEYGLFGPSGKKDLTWTHAQLKDSLTSWEEFVRRDNPWADIS